MGAANDEKKRI